MQPHTYHEIVVGEENTENIEHCASSVHPHIPGMCTIIRLSHMTCVLVHFLLGNFV